MKQTAIGVLDSGIGGLSVTKSLIAQSPAYSVIYVGDSAQSPYGNKSEAEIYERSIAMVTFLLEKHVSVIVIACNTISVTCLTKLREKFPQISFIGTVPVIKLAAKVTRNGSIGLLATTITSESTYTKTLWKEYASEYQMTIVGNDALVPLIEQDRVQSEYFEQLVAEIVEPFRKAAIDTLILGCTHFPLIKGTLQKSLGGHVVILDSGEAIARQVQRVVGENNDLATEAHTFYTSGSTTTFRRILHRLDLSGTVRTFSTKSGYLSRPGIRKASIIKI